MLPTASMEHASKTVMRYFRNENGSRPQTARTMHAPVRTWMDSVIQIAIHGSSMSIMLVFFRGAAEASDAAAPMPKISSQWSMTEKSPVTRYRCSIMACCPFSSPLPILCQTGSGVSMRVVQGRKSDSSTYWPSFPSTI